jgi:hypothetical protein
MPAAHALSIQTLLGGLQEIYIQIQIIFPSGPTGVKPHT